MIEEIHALKNELRDLQAVLKSLHLKLQEYENLNQRLVRQLNTTWKMKTECSAQALPRRHSF